MKNILVAAFVILVLFAGAVSAQHDIEINKIEFLISSVENIKGAKFIRNGLEYDAKEAGSHLRMKLRLGGSEIQSANDFILLCASKSSVTGIPYSIRFADGKKIKSEDYFRAKLKEYH
jgi:hypothetical protein